MDICSLRLASLCLHSGFAYIPSETAFLPHRDGSGWEKEKESHKQWGEGCNWPQEAGKEQMMLSAKFQHEILLCCPPPPTLSISPCFLCLLTALIHPAPLRGPVPPLPWRPAVCLISWTANGTNLMWASFPGFSAPTSRLHLSSLIVSALLPFAAVY